MIEDPHTQQIVPILEETKRMFRDRNVKVVFPTMSAMNYKIHNHYYSRHHYKRCIMQDFYKEFQDNFCERVVRDNGLIVRHNREQGVHTPFLNKKTIKSGKFSYTRRKLYDGLHPHYELRRVWEKELLHNFTLNWARWRHTL